MTESARPVNPVHFKPMWQLVRMGDSVDFTEEESLLHFSDAEVILLKIMAGMFADGFMLTGDARGRRFAERSKEVYEKLSTLLRFEFEDAEQNSV